MTGALFIIGLLVSPAVGAGEDTILARELSAVTTGFHGTVGVYARHLKTGHWAAINADDIFPTASMIKVPILAGLFDRISSGTLDYNQEFKYEASRAHGDEQMLGHYRDSETITTAKLIWLMESISDNTAALWCQELAGGGGGINAWLEAHGFAKTRVNSRTPGREEAKKQYGWGQTTPREIADLLVMIRDGKAVSPAASAEMFRALSRTYWDEESIAALPPTAHVASKQGAVEHSRSEVLLVSAPSGDYVLGTITKDQADTRYEHNNEGYELLRKVSAAVWKRWGGKPWTPAAGSERYWKKD